MRIRVPKEALVVAALVLAVVIPSSRPAYTWLRRISAKKQLNINDGLAHPESSTDPQVLLAEANRLYWLNNGPKAAPLYAKAESLFASRGDARNELYAKIGHLRSEAETMSFVDLSRFLSDQLQNPIMRNDPRLRLWCLAAKGYAKSLMDYIARWLELRFLTGDQGELFKALPIPVQPAMDANGTDPVGALGELIQMGDAPACNICGSLMVRSGTCYRCMTCGSTSGCS